MPDGGTVTVSVSAERDCTWSARSDASWLVLRQTSGQGEGAFTATVARNEQPVSRSASLTVNDQRLTITQQARPCDLSLQGFTGTISAAGGTATVRVTTISGCAWTATSSAPWLIVRTGSGSGSGDVRFDVLSNDGPAREATITVAGQSTVITQAAAVVAPVCSYGIDSQTQSFPVAGGTGTVTVTTQDGCQWTATGGADWVTLLTPSGVGPGQAQYQVSANPTTDARQTTLTIAGRVHTVSQPGLSCTYAIAPQDASYPSSGGTGSLQVNTLGGCAWEAVSNAGWIVVGTRAGSGTGQIAYQVLPNTLAAGRTGTITVGGQTHAVTQEGAPPPCTYSLDPASRAVPASGGSHTVTVNTQGACAWTAESSVPWITVPAGTRTGTGTVSYSVAENTTATERTGNVTIAGQTHTVTQAAAAPACSYAIDPASNAIGAGGGSGTVAVKTGATCAWTAVSSEPWITIATGSTSGSGPASVGYTVAPNATTSPRTGVITIAGQTHTVTQEAAALCSYSLNPTSADVPAGASQGSVTVNTQPGCSWSATSTVPWVTVTSLASGAGTATVTYSVAANTTTAPRSGAIQIAGQTHAITQAAAAATEPAVVACAYSITPEEWSFGRSGGNGTIALTTGATCAWTAVASAGWVTVANGSGIGPDVILYSVNASGGTRMATITVGDQTHRITQTP